MIGKRVRWDGTPANTGIVLELRSPVSVHGRARRPWARVRLDDGRIVERPVEWVWEIKPDPDSDELRRAFSSHHTHQARGHVAVAPGRCSCGARFLAWGRPSSRALGKHIGRWMERQKRRSA